jgi:hypothetical protein
MSLTQIQIIDELMQRLTDAWTPTGFMIVYPDKVLTQSQIDLIDGKNSAELLPWARVTVRTSQRNQKTFGSGPATRFYETLGMLFVEIYTPTGSGLAQAYELATLVRDAFEGFSSPSSIWYRNVRIQEAGQEGLWSHLNVLIDWQAEENK